MAILTSLAGVLRGSTRHKHLEVNQYGELLTAQGLPPYTEIVRQGVGYSVYQETVKPVLVVRPSTVSMITLLNGESADGKSYIIDRIGAHQIVSKNAAATFCLWACVHPMGVEAGVTGDIAISVNNWQSPLGSGWYGGLARCDEGEGVVDNGWYPWGYSTSCELAGSLPGAAIDVPVEGRIILRPGAALSLTGVGGTVDIDLHCFASWYEVHLDFDDAD